MEIFLNNPRFWNLVTNLEGKLLRHGSLRYLVMDHSVKMVPLIRKKTELFLDMLRRDGARMNACINGSYYDLSFLGSLDAAFGTDPVAANKTTILGQVVSNGVLVAGSTEPERFFFAQMRVPTTNAPGWTFFAGAGDPPKNASIIAAIGGLGPLIVEGLRYGDGNKGRPGTTGLPLRGDPGGQLSKSLIQRNNNTFISVEKRPPTTGKTILASHSRLKKLLIAVQPDGVLPGQSYTTLAEQLLALGFDNAVFLDGSDSATLMVNGALEVQPGGNKDETNTLGIGFLR
ncbi:MULTISPECIES: phosphodiester glycosidase family protein [Roseomonadaceae]|uniref:Phosphodiester glycosidase family protein n=1 Tax=Falsiroseomonas oleicola TaxID=2801474 RepID=A0ABS6H2Z3_9PROT|nr:phosphodiester glycosidase family protein [Roseomonas oleicola]MBU8543037.1 phosphodiester glycosidase family protein [Roseomonas oleicola]